jgi:hypothetical protein
MHWMNGYTLQQSMLSSAVQWERPLGLWLAQQHDLCVALSIATLVLELAFPLALFVPRSRPVLLMSTVVFHVGMYLTMNIGFFQHVVLLAVFVDFHGLAARLRSVPRSERAAA